MFMKILYVIRGICGSGKSTLARQLCKYTNVAADDYMIDNEGKYSFDAERLHYCHTKCQNQVEEWMNNDKIHEHRWIHDKQIAVHNTFTTMKEIKPYLELAEKYGYSVHVIHCESNFGNVHNVPPETIQKMKDRWQRYE